MNPWQQAWDAQFDPATSHPDRPGSGVSASSHTATPAGATSNIDLPPVGVHPQDVPPAVLGEPRTATPAAVATPVEPVGAPHADRLPADHDEWCWVACPHTPKYGQP
jgi:hypothetical protein